MCGISEAEVAGAEAALHQAQARRATAGDTPEAPAARPFAGVVSAKLTELGEWVDQGNPCWSWSRWMMCAWISRCPGLPGGYPSGYATDLQPQRRSGPGVQGSVDTVVPITDPGARTFLLRVLAHNPDQRLLPGMSVQARLHLATGRSGLVVPRTPSCASRMAAWSCGRWRTPGRAENLVTPGLGFDSQVEIREGLQAGATVVVEGNEALQNGQRVTSSRTPAGNWAPCSSKSSGTAPC